MDEVISAVQDACAERSGEDPLHMADGIIEAYLNAKLHHIEYSVALYSISSDVDGAEIAKAAYVDARRAVTAMFTTAAGLRKQPEMVATVVLAAMNGIARRLLESATPEQDYEPLKNELRLLVHSYLRACLSNEP